MNRSTLISFSKPHRIMAFSLLALFIVLVGLHIHQYSLPEWRLVLEDDGNGGTLLGAPQPIRQDDWGAEIPLMLSQVSHKPPFPVVNTNIGTGLNQLAPLKLPVLHVLALFKPTTWGFFLGADVGLAWMWWSMVLGCFYVFFLLFMLISGNRFFLSVMGGLLLLFSPFFQFWSMHGSEIPMFMALMFIAFAYLTFGAGKKVVLANGALLGWSGGCFMLNFIYPPYQVALAYLLVFMTGGFILSRYSELDLGKSRAIRLAGLAIALAVAVFAAAAFFIYAREVIDALAATVYPGKRLSTGGDFEPWMLFSNTLFVHLYGFFHFGSAAPSAIGWADMKNICEYSSFIFLFPVLILTVIARNVAAKKIVDPLSLLVSAYLVITLVYMFFGFPTWLSVISGFSRLPANREVVGLGIAGIILLVSLLSKPAYFELPQTFKLIAAAGWAALLIFSATGLFAKWPVAPLPFLLAASVAVAFVSYFLLCAGTSRTALAVLAALSIVSTAWFNPVVRGGSEIFSSNPLCREILAIDARQAGATRWVTFTPLEMMSNVFRILGVKALDGTYPYPRMDLWKNLDPQQQAADVYNRYAYATFVPVMGANVKFFLRDNDFFSVGIDPGSEALRTLGVTHYLVTGLNPIIFDQSHNLKKVFSYRHSQIYEVVDRR